MDERLREAAHEGNIERLYGLIREDPNILERNIDDKLLADTPLHVAASTGKHHFAAEVMRLKPSYARKLNPDGLSPIHVALRGGHDRMVEWFVSVDSNLIRDKGGEGTTPLHYVIAMGNVNLLRLFLLACPDSIEDLTTKRETALHVALKYFDERIFEVLAGWLKRVDKEDIFKWTDEDGNTVLHMATSDNQTQAVKLLLSKKIINKIMVNAQNNMGLTALDIFQLPMSLKNREIGDMLCRAKALGRASIEDDPIEEMDLSGELSLYQKFDKYFGISTVQKKSPNDLTQAVLTVAVLIATATFQAVLSPPGGFWQDDYIPSVHNATGDGMTRRKAHYAGTTVMNIDEFCIFYILNGATFFASMAIIHLHTIGLPHKPLHLSKVALCATYDVSLLVTMPERSNFTDHFNAATLHAPNFLCTILLLATSFRWILKLAGKQQKGFYKLFSLSKRKQVYLAYLVAFLYGLVVISSMFQFVAMILCRTLGIRTCPQIITGRPQGV